MRKMNKNNFRYIFAMLIFLLCTKTIFSEQIGFEFINQEISEIVYAISLSKDFPIICDDTIVGKADFRFSGGDFNTAFDSFLLRNRLYVIKEDNCWIVTKVLVQTSNENISENIISVDAYDVMSNRIIEKISEKTNFPIVHDLLPTTPISVHFQNVSIEIAIAMIMKNFTGYNVIRDKNYIQIEREVITQTSYTQTSAYYSDSQKADIVFDENGYNGDIENAAFVDVLEKIAIIQEFQFCSLVRKDSLINRCVFSSRSFDETLSLLASIANVAYSKQDELYVFYSLTTNYDQLTKTDKKWEVFNVSYGQVDKIANNLAKKFPNIIFSILDEYRIECLVSSEEEKDIRLNINQWDTPTQCHTIYFQYINVTDFLKVIPKEFQSHQFVESGHDTTLFFYGSKESYDLLIAKIKIIDQPLKRVAYDLLILETQKSTTNSWASEIKASKLKPGNFSSIEGAISSFGMFNIDIVAGFGYLFASKLQAAVAENQAIVYADTTLYGMSGSSIQFRNTNTFRYRDLVLDADTGKKLETGVTREIVSGLILDIKGWASGDGMVTTSVTASVSRQGADVSSSGNPPPTSEKIVTTQVRGRSGEVIILSGLMQDDSTIVEERTPFLSKIPLLGWLFKSNRKTKEKTEMVIYLIPWLEDDIPSYGFTKESHIKDKELQ